MHISRTILASAVGVATLVVFPAITFATTMADLGSASGSSRGTCAGGDSGRVQGSPGSPAFIYSGGVVANLGVLGRTFGYSYGIIDSGKYLGNSYTTGTSVVDAFLCPASVMTNLGSLGGSLSEAFGVTLTERVAGDPNTAFNESDKVYLYSGLVTDEVAVLSGFNVAGPDSPGDLLIDFTASDTRQASAPSDGFGAHSGLDAAVPDSSAQVLTDFSAPAMERASYDAGGPLAGLGAYATSDTGAPSYGITTPLRDVRSSGTSGSSGSSAKPEGESTVANPSGQVVVFNTPGRVQAFLYSNGTVSSLATSGFSDSRPAQQNSSTQTASYPALNLTGATTDAFAYYAGMMSNRNSDASDSSTSQPQSNAAQSDDTQIVTTATNNAVPAVLVPAVTETPASTPEPASVLLFGTGVALLWMKRRTLRSFPG